MLFRLRWRPTKLVSISKYRLRLHNRMTPICIPPDRVDAFWPQVDSLIKRAIIRGGLSDFAEIESAVHAGGMLLWIAWDGQKIAAAAITQLGLINGIKCGTIIACAG